jgi:uncharacterized protein YbaA (DUF1428 family)
MSYITGFLIPVKAADKDRYLESARKSWPLFQKYGCLEQVETWGEDIPEGETTSFPRAVKLEPGEAVVFSWLRWPDRATADKCFEQMMSDPEFDGMDMPFDGKRMMWAGFDPIFEGR